MITILVEKSENVRLDLFLSEYFKEENLAVSRTQIQNDIVKNLIKVNERDVDKKYIPKLSDVITYKRSLEELGRAGQKPEIEVIAQDLSIEVIYEDEDVALINKPKNMVVHIDEHNHRNTLVNALKFRFESLSDAAGEDRPGIVHRLDRDTSGMMIIAKNNEAYEHLKLQFQNREIYKKYLALVHGGFAQKEGVIDACIGRHPKNRLLRGVNGDGARPAITEYKVLEEQGAYSLVQCVLLTGRTHQIRVHMKYCKHPIYGDNLYGIKAHREHEKGQFLHSHTLGFKHMKTGEYMEFSCELPQYFKDKLKSLGFQTDVF